MIAELELDSMCPELVEVIAFLVMPPSLIAVLRDQLFMCRLVAPGSVKSCIAFVSVLLAWRICHGGWIKYRMTCRVCGSIRSIGRIVNR